MKNIAAIVAASFLGGAVALGGSYLLTKNNNTPKEQLTIAREVGDFVAPGTGVDFAEAAKRSTASVVHIYAKQAPKQQQQQQRRTNDPFELFFGQGFNFQQPPAEGTGSGVIITEDGYIVTNNHVVDFADDIKVTLSDNREYSAKIVGTDPNTDLAVLKIEASNLPAIQKGDSDKARVGEWVLAIGNPAVGYDRNGRPQQLNSTVTAGIISAKGRDINVNESGSAIESFIQTDAVVNPGNSGGALVDDAGRLIGINTAIATTNGRYQGYSFAIPISLMNRVVDDIIQYGRYKRVVLGVSIVELDGELSKEMGLEVTEGLVIREISKNSSAMYAGLQLNDIITQINGRAIRTFPDLQESIGRSKAGDTITVTIVRNNEVQKVSVALRES